jgi:tetratricopeptide (TPR) repeat protein
LTNPAPSLHSFDYAPITTEQLEEATKLEAALRATPTNELKNQVAELADSLQQGSEKPQLEGARNLWAAMFEVSESKDDYALFALGSTLRKMGDNKAAVAAMSPHASIDNDGSVNLLLGDSYRALGDAGAATAALEAALKIRPTDAGIAERIARIKAGDLAEHKQPPQTLGGASEEEEEGVAM